MHGLLQSLLLVEANLDDESLSLRAVSKCRIPCETSVIRDGFKAIEILSMARGTAPDLIVLDFHLPGYGGIEILRQLRSKDRTRYCPVVVLSSLATPQELNNCLSEGASSCVQKPVDPFVYCEHISLIDRYWLTVDARSS
jgi:CheY-like chemotaxis protein